MGFASGKGLSALAVAAMVLAAAALVRVAVTEGIACPAGAAAPAGPAALPYGEHVALARAAESRGDVAKALGHYRAAVSLEPGCVDRRSPAWLGDPFEANLRTWIAALRADRGKGSAEALRDASFLFRRMYGGCG